MLINFFSLQFEGIYVVKLFVFSNLMYYNLFNFIALLLFIAKNFSFLKMFIIFLYYFESKICLSIIPIKLIEYQKFILNYYFYRLKLLINIFNHFNFFLFTIECIIIIEERFPSFIVHLFFNHFISHFCFNYLNFCIKNNSLNICLYLFSLAFINFPYFFNKKLD